MSSFKELEMLNKPVQEWANETKNLLKAGISNVTAKTFQKDGIVSKVRIKFDRYGVFVEKGAGRGYGGNKGSKWRGKNGIKSTNKTSLGKMGTGSRTAKPWFNPVLEKQYPKLAKIIAETTANAVVKDIKKLLIK